MTTRYTDANRLNRDARVAIRLRDAGAICPIDAIRAGADVLMPIESAEIGDVGGERIAHLPCHFGLDSLPDGVTAPPSAFSPSARKPAR